MDITFPFLETLFYHNILSLSDTAKHITGIEENPTPPIEPSPVDPGVSHPSGYHPVQHHDYHHEKCA